MLRFSEEDGRLRFEVRVQPRSSRNQIVGEQEGALKIKLTAPPVDGEANQALVAFLSQFFGVAKRDVQIVKGETSRHKSVSINGLKSEMFLKKIGQS
ncbi:MAG: DUF167 domain-containing protein [Syntrophomonadaceae bacterium]|nr:DUF167 domain-containing protein [Syntrophomonadaceae bacterium]